MSDLHREQLFARMQKEFGVFVEEYNKYLYENPNGQLDIHKEINDIMGILYSLLEKLHECNE